MSCIMMHGYHRSSHLSKGKLKKGDSSNDMDLQIASNKYGILSTGPRTNLPDYYINNVGLLIIKRSRSHL